MKRILPLIFCLLAVACQPIDVTLKNDANNKETDSKHLHIRISAYEFLPFESRAARPVEDMCTHLGIGMFRLSGERLFTTKNQKAGDSSFGSLDVSVEPGTYILVCVGHRGEGNATLSSPTEVKFFNNKMTDTFSSCDTIVVTGSEQTVDVSLKRRVAMVRFSLDEVLPDDVKQLRFVYTGGSSTLNPATGFGSVKSRQTEVRDVSSKAYTMPGSAYDLYTLPHAERDTLKFVITALDETGSTVIEREVADVPVKIGMITMLHGTMQGSDDNKLHIGISIDDDGWQQEDIRF